jgi:hypothetical protein
MPLSIKLTNLHNTSKEMTKRKKREDSVEEDTADVTEVYTNKIRVGKYKEADLIIKENKVIIVDDSIQTTIDVEERKQGSYGVYVKTYEDDDVQIVPGPQIDSYTSNYLKSKLHETIPKYAKAAIMNCLGQFKEQKRAFEVGSDLIIKEEAFGSLIMNRDMVKGRAKGTEWYVNDAIIVEYSLLLTSRYPDTLIVPSSSYCQETTSPDKYKKYVRLLLIHLLVN